MGHSCRKLLQGTVLGHSCGTLLWGTLVGHFVGHSCGTLLWDTLVGHSCRTCRTLSWDILLWVTLVGSICRALFWDTLYTTNHPARQRRAFTPACFALPSGTAPRKRTFHLGRASPNGAATSGTSCRHTVCPCTHWKENHHMIPQIIPLTSDARLHQHVSRSPVARRHANTLPTKVAQFPMALQHHEPNFATRSAHTLEANMSHESTNHPAHQRHAAFTPPCFPLPAPRERTFHQGRANPNGAGTSRTSCRHTVCPY